MESKPPIPPRTNSLKCFYSHLPKSCIILQFVIQYYFYAVYLHENVKKNIIKTILQPAVNYREKNEAHRRHVFLINKKKKLFGCTPRLRTFSGSEIKDLPPGARMATGKTPPGSGFVGAGGGGGGSGGDSRVGRGGGG